MPLTKRVADVYLFPTGILAVCDANGEQIGELQGPYSINKHKRIVLEALPDCNFRGFEILPSGFIQSINNWYMAYKGKDISWEEINNEYYLDGDPVCPNCNKSQNGAIGATRMPHAGDFSICSYCAAMNRYQITDGIFSLRAVNDEDLQVAKDCGMLERLVATRDFVKIKITPRK